MVFDRLHKASYLVEQLSKHENRAS